MLVFAEAKGIGTIPDRPDETLLPACFDAGGCDWGPDWVGSPGDEDLARLRFNVSRTAVASHNPTR